VHGENLLIKNRDHASSRVVIWLGVVLLVGCGRGSALEEGSFPTWTVGSVPLASIGGDDQRSDYLLYRVVGATRLSDGRIAVASAAASQIKYFDSSGTHLRTVGREGDGPGEFRGILSLLPLPGDTLLVLSERPGLTWLSPQGEYIRSMPVGVWGRERHPCRISGDEWRVLSDGRLVTTFEDNPGIRGCAPAPVVGTHRETEMLEVQDYEAQHFDTIAVLPGTERTGRHWRVFGPLLHFATSGDRVYAADARSAEILVLTSQGDTLARWPTPFAPERVPAEAKLTSERVLTMRNGAKEVEVYDYPEFYPRLGRLLTDRQGYLWVMGYPRFLKPASSISLRTLYNSTVEDGGARWRVLRPDGSVVATVRTPAGLFPIEIGLDYVLGVTMDEYDVEEIRLYSLDRSE